MLIIKDAPCFVSTTRLDECRHQGCCCKLGLVGAVVVGLLIVEVAKGSTTMMFVCVDAPLLVLVYGSAHDPFFLRGCENTLRLEENVFVSFWPNITVGWMKELHPSGSLPCDDGNTGQWYGAKKACRPYGEKYCVPRKRLGFELKFIV